jgi:hypothetical protein
VLERAGVVGSNAFADSLHAQFGRKGSLSEKQFAILARMAAENAGEGDGGLLEQLKEYVPAAVQAPAPDPALPELMAMLGEIGQWREPVKRGKRVFDDREFAESLKAQFARRKTLTARQVSALKKMLLSYREGIADFAERAAKAGISVPSGGAKKKGGRTRRS